MSDAVLTNIRTRRDCARCLTSRRAKIRPHENLPIKLEASVPLWPFFYDRVR